MKSSIKHSDEPKVISLKDIDFGFKKNSDDEDGELGSDHDNTDEDDDDFDEEKLKQSSEDRALEQEILDEENNALEELHSVLSKARNKTVLSKTSLPEALIKEDVEIKSEKEEHAGIDFDQLNKIDEDEEENSEQKNALTLDTMSEFCRNLGDIPYGAIGKRNRDKHLNNAEDEDDEDFDETKTESKTIKKKSMDTDDDDDSVEKKPTQNSNGKDKPISLFL